jgi:hypothetical protein
MSYKRNYNHILNNTSLEEFGVYSLEYSKLQTENPKLVISKIVQPYLYCLITTYIQKQIISF